MLTLDIAKIRERLAHDNQRMLERYDPDESIEFLDSVPSHKSYHYLPQGLHQLWAALSLDFGSEGFDAFQKLTMLRLMERFELRAVGEQYSESIRDRFAFSFRRIVQSMANPVFDKYQSDNDILLKDLAICRQKVFPAGAQLVEKDSGFHRSLIFRAGLHQSVRVIALLIRTSGNRPFYQIHTHLSELEEFNREGWDHCYLRIADMLRLHPDTKGVWSGSWYFDPALEKISPRLSYLRERAIKNGASLFYDCVDIDGGALSKSKSRQDLYKQGKYLPKVYAMIWPRKQLLAWASRFERGSRST